VSGVLTIDRRPAHEEDRAFFALLYASTREEELAAVPWDAAQKEAFVAQQFAAQRAHYAEHYADASFEVVTVDDEPGGRLIVARREGAIRIVDISLLPRYRGRGVGTRVLRPLLDEADRVGATMTIHVEHFNRARGLYERLGFSAVAEDGMYLRMERPPGAGSGEDRLVARPGLVAADGHDEDLEGAGRVVVEPVDPLGENGLGRPAEEQGEGGSLA
jgi:ribosomal protein S18 acetylase RimI-like enzyme